MMGILMEENLYTASLDTPVGRLFMASSDRGLVRILLPDQKMTDSIERLHKLYPDARFFDNPEKNIDPLRQIEEFFETTRRAFSLQLDLRGTPFQKRVWEAVSRVPYGSFTTYGAIARTLGKPAASRAVGLANKENPLPIVVPCHRIVGAAGQMTGFGGGIWMKEELLRREGVDIPIRLEI
jgi:O-6-methylguanine DNA methyltransferase